MPETHETTPDVALLGFLAGRCAIPRHLTPHVSQHERAAADGADRGPDVILERRQRLSGESAGLDPHRRSLAPVVEHLNPQRPRPHARHLHDVRPIHRQAAQTLHALYAREIAAAQLTAL